MGSKTFENYYFDIEEEYLKGLTNLEQSNQKIIEKKDTRERLRSEVQKKSAFLIESPKENKNITYLVRLPIIHPYNNVQFDRYPILFYFYFRSFRNQEYWIQRNAHIVI